MLYVVPGSVRVRVSGVVIKRETMCVCDYCVIAMGGGVIAVGGCVCAICVNARWFVFVWTQAGSSAIGLCPGEVCVARLFYPFGRGRALSLMISLHFTNSTDHISV